MSKLSGIRAGRAFVEIGANDDRLRKTLKAAEHRLRAFGGMVRSLGGQMMAAGSAITTPFLGATKTFASFEQQMARVKAVSGATDEEFAKLSAKAKQLGASTVFSASQAAEAMGNFALAGYDVNTILNAVGPTLDLAAAGQIEIAESADIAAKIMSGMGIEAADLGHVMDVLAKAMTTANTDISMLGEAFKYVGPIAKTAGIGLEEITASIQLLSNAGMQGEMAGTILRGMILALTSPSREAAEMLNKLGVAVKDQRGNFRGMTAIIADFQRGMAGMGNAQQLEALGTIFGARQAAGASELISQGAGAMRDATARVGDSAGTAARIAATQLDTLTGSVKIVLSALEGLAIEVGDAVAPAFRRFTERAIQVLDALSALARNNRDTIVLVARVAAGLIAAGGALVGLGVAARLAAIGTRLLAASVGLLTSPIGLTIVLVGGAVAAFLTLTETGRATFATLKSVATDAMGGIANALKSGDIELAGQILWLSLRVLWQKGIVALNDLTYGFIDSFINAFRDVQYAVSEAMINIVAFFERSFARLIGLIKGFAAAAWTAVSGGDFRAALDAAGAGIDAKVSEINARRDATLDTLANQREVADRSGGVDAELARLEGELKSALEQAAEQAAPKPEEVAEEAVRERPGLAAIAAPGALERTASKTDVSGSFSAAALRGMGAGSTAADRTADATERAADGIESLNDRARQGRLVFEP